MRRAKEHKKRPQKRPRGRGKVVTWKRGDGRRMHGGKMGKEREKKVEINAIKIAIGYFSAIRPILGPGP